MGLAQHRWPRTSIWPGIAPPPTLPPGEGIAPPPTLPPGDGIAPPPTLPPGTNPANSQDHTTSDPTVNHPVTIGFHSTWKTHDGQTAAILMPLAPKWAHKTNAAVAGEMGPLPTEMGPIHMPTNHRPVGLGSGQ